MQIQPVCRGGPFEMGSVQCSTQGLLLCATPGLGLSCPTLRLPPGTPETTSSIYDTCNNYLYTLMKNKQREWHYMWNRSLLFLLPGPLTHKAIWGLLGFAEGLGKQPILHYF